MNIKRALIFPLSAWLLTASLTVPAEPRVVIDADRVTIEPQGSDAAEVLQVLAEKLGFSLSGQMEAAANSIDYALDDSIDRVINQLASPQSVIIMYDTDDNGQRRVSSVELLPTGDSDSQFLDNGKSVNFRPAKLTGDPAKDQHRLERQQRRDERHAQGLGRRNKPGFGEGVSKEELQQVREEALQR